MLPGGKWADNGPVLSDRYACEMSMLRRFLFCCLISALDAGGGAALAEDKRLLVAVLDNAPPQGYRDGTGQLTGFSTAVMRALCAEIKVDCEFQGVVLDSVIDDLAAGRFDVAAIGMLNTPDRRQKILFTRPVYRSQTLMFAKRGSQLGQAGLRLSTFRGSAHERYLRSQGWDAIGARDAGEIVRQLQAGVSQGVIVPLMSSLHLRHLPSFLELELEMSVLAIPGLDSDAAFGVAPQRAELKVQLDKALARIKRNGVFDQINSQFLPFRVE